VEQNINFSADKCVQCESTNGLNTFVHLIIDDKKIVAGVCDDHLGISVSKVREIIVGKRNRLLKLIEEMKSLGLDISTIAGGVAVVEDKKKVEVEVQQVKVEPEPEVRTNKVNVRKVNKKLANVRSISGEGASSYSAYDVDKMIGKEAKAAGCEAPVVEEVELQIVNGKNGIPVQIPKKIRESTGETEIHIVPTSNKMIDRGKYDERSFVGSYQLRECNLCGGTGKSHSKGHNVCPKCKGTGNIT
jgi:hypothetical protein